MPPVTLGDNTGVPLVPTNADFPYDRTNTIFAILFMGAFGVAGLVVTIRRSALRRLAAAFVALGTVVIVVPEVFVDIIGMVYYPTTTPTTPSICSAVRWAGSSSPRGSAPARSG